MGSIDTISHCFAEETKTATEAEQRPCSPKSKGKCDRKKQATPDTPLEFDSPA